MHGWRRWGAAPWSSRWCLASKQASVGKPICAFRSLYSQQNHTLPPLPPFSHKKIGIRAHSKPQFVNRAPIEIAHDLHPLKDLPVTPLTVTPLMQDITLYSRQAIYAAVMSWFNDPWGPAASGEFAATGAKANSFEKAVDIKFDSPEGFAENGKVLEGISNLVEVINLGDSNTCSWGILWKEPPEGSGLSKGQLPEYFVDGKATWVSKIPKETGLATATFYPPDSEDSYHPYVSPTKPGAWTSPGPTGEPQTVTLGDGTKVTYAWYKFVDQPALQNLKLTEDQNRQLQSRIELLHKNWTITGKYMKPPSKGSLVSMDPKLIVEPPSGLEVGYVPIVTKQESS